MDQYLLESPYSQYDVLTSILAKSLRGVRYLPTAGSPRAVPSPSVFESALPARLAYRSMAAVRMMVEYTRG